MIDTQHCLGVGIDIQTVSETKICTIFLSLLCVCVCLQVKVTLTDSDQYTFRSCEGCQYNVCLCGEESRTFSWIVTPTALGRTIQIVFNILLLNVQACQRNHVLCCFD